MHPLILVIAVAHWSTFGEAIGITSLKVSTAGVKGMDYAINIAEALPVIQKLSK